MNKKIINRILVVSGLTLSLSVVSVSCKIEMKNKQENPTKPEITPDKRKETDINTEAKKVIVGYPKKSEIRAESTRRDEYVFHGYNDKKYKILLIKTSGDSRKGFSIVNFKLIDLTNENNQSDEISTILYGFKKAVLRPDDFGYIRHRILFDYPDKENVYPWDIKPEKMIISIPFRGFKVWNIRVKSFNEDGDVEFSFNYFDEYNPSSRYPDEKVVKGFKAAPKDTSNFRRSLFNDKRKFIQLNDDKERKINLYNELTKPNWEVTFNFATNKIVIPISDKEINLSKPETYYEVTQTNSEYSEAFAELTKEITKLMSDTLKVDRLDTVQVISLFLTLSKRRALSELNWYKDKLEQSLQHLMNQLDIEKDFIENFKKIINNENFLVIFDVKNGTFGMRDKKAEMDSDGAKPSMNFIKTKSHFQNQINAKIHQVLSRKNFSPETIDFLLNNPNVGLEFIFQKNGDKLVTGLRVKNVPKI